MPARPSRAEDALPGRIESIFVSDVGMEVSGAVPTPDGVAALRLLCDDLEIGRIGAAPTGAFQHAEETVRRFTFRVTVPLGFNDIAALTVATGGKRFGVDATTRISAALPLFLALDDVRGSDLHAPDPSQPRQRIAFAAEVRDGRIEGVVIDLGHPEESLQLDLMAGPARLASVTAGAAAAFTVDDRTIEGPWGFSLRLPEVPAGDPTANDETLWLGLSELPSAASRERARRTDRINLFRPLPDMPHGRGSVSIIVTSRNQAALVSGFLEALREAGPPDCEVLVVDAGSEAELGPICAKHGRDRRIELVEGTELLSSGQAWNLGAGAARGDVLIFADPAIRMQGDVLERLALHLADPSVGAAGVGVMVPAPWSRAAAGGAIRGGLCFTPDETGAAGPTPLYPATTGRCSPMCVPALDGALLGCRAALFRTVGGFDEAIADDAASADLSLRIRESCMLEVVTFNDLVAVQLPAQEAGQANAGATQATGSTAWQGRIGRTVRADLLDRPGFWAGRPPRVLVIAPDVRSARGNDAAIAALATGLAEIVPCRVTKGAADGPYDLSGIDMLIIADPDYDLSQVTGAAAGLCCYALASGSLDRWLQCAWLHLVAGLWVMDEAARQLLRAHAPILLPLFADPGAPHAAGAPGSSSAPQRHDAPGAGARPQAGPGSSGVALARRVMALHRLAARTVLRLAIEVAGLPGREPAGTEADRTAHALAAALRRLGHMARVDDVSGSGADHPFAAADDCVVVLRGHGRPARRRAASRILWVVDRPDDVSAEEMSQYDHVFLASEAAVTFFTSLAAVPVTSLLLGADAPAEPLRPAGERRGGGLVYVGDADEADGSALEHALALGMDVAVYGRGWDDLVPRRLIRAEGLTAELAAAVYAEAAIVLVDHKPSRRSFGFLSKSLFDAAAAGAAVLCDRVAGIEPFLGPSIQVFDDRASFAAAVASLLSAAHGAADEDASAARGRFVGDHSMEERARVIVDVARTIVGADRTIY